MTEAADPAVSKDFSQSDRNLRAAHKKLTGNEFLVYFGLVQIADCQGQVKKSLEELKQECNVRRTTLIKVLDSLVDMGMVRRLGNKHKGYTYQVTQLEDWVERPTRGSTDSVLRRTKAIASKVYNKVVRKLDVTKQTTEQPDSCTTPLIGGSAESEVVQEQSGNCTSQEVQELNQPETEPTFTDVDDKLEAMRKLGCNVGRCWQQSEMFVRVDGILMSVAQFMERSLESFMQALQPCLEGLELCRAQIKKIKQQKMKLL
jgi:predicted transcriptional regulator